MLHGVSVSRPNVQAWDDECSAHLPHRYLCALTSSGLQTCYLLLVERSGVSSDVSTTELLLYNALLSLPFLLLVCQAALTSAHMASAQHEHKRRL